MSKDGEAFSEWLEAARIPRRRLSHEQLAVLRAVFAFLQHCGRDYASLRIVAHFLLHCEVGLKLAQVSRLNGVTRPTISRQNKLSSREVVREIQHRASGRPYGKLLPRYAGPIAEFIVTHPDAMRADILDFVDRTWHIQVSPVALHNFLKKYGLDRASRAQAAESDAPSTVEDAASIKVCDEPSTLPVSMSSEDFFCPHPVCGCIPTDADHASLVGNCPEVLQR